MINYVADFPQSLHALAVPRHDAATMRALLRSVGAVMGHSYWRVRVAGLAFLQAAAFHNMFLLLSQADAAQTVRRAPPPPPPGEGLIAVTG